MSWANDLTDMMAQPRRTGRGLQLCTMAAPNVLQVGQIQVSGPNLKIASHLLTKTCTQVAGTCPSGGGALSDRSTYSPALAAGDEVLVYQIDDSTFLIIERMVSV